MARKKEIKRRKTKPVEKNESIGRINIDDSDPVAVRITRAANHLLQENKRQRNGSLRKMQLLNLRRKIEKKNPATNADESSNDNNNKTVCYH